MKPFDANIPRIADNLLSMHYERLCQMTIGRTNCFHNADTIQRLQLLVDLYICQSFLRHVSNKDVGFKIESWELLCHYLADHFTFITGLKLKWTKPPLFNLSSLRKCTGEHILYLAEYPRGYPKKHKSIALSMAVAYAMQHPMGKLQALEEPEQQEGLFDYFKNDTSLSQPTLSGKA